MKIKLILLILFLSSLSAFAKTPKEIYKASKDSVIYLYYDEIAENGQTARHFGTGFIIDEKGLCLTNAHVLNKALKAQNAEGKPVKILSIEKIDQKNDLATIKLEGEFKPLGFANQAFEVGDNVVVISNSASFQNTLSVGIVSGMRTIQNLEKFQFTASIAQGSSGAPVFNEEGEVIGVVVGLFDKLNAQNINFGIPLNVIYNFMH